MADPALSRRLGYRPPEVPPNLSSPVILFMILYSDTGNGVGRCIRICSMGWGWNLLPVATLMLLCPHKSYILSELQLNLSAVWEQFHVSLGHLQG